MPQDAISITSLLIPLYIYASLFRPNSAAFRPFSSSPGSYSSAFRPNSFLVYPNSLNFRPNSSNIRCHSLLVGSHSFFVRLNSSNFRPNSSNIRVNSFISRNTAATYNNSLGDNKLIDKSSSIASADIDALLSANGIIIGKLSKLMIYFKNNDPNFYQEYQKVIILDKSGIRHTGVRGVATNGTTEAPVKEVTIIYHGKTEDKNKITSTDSKGTYELIKLIPGERTFTITAPGYNSQTITVKLIRGAIITLDFVLQSQSISINAATA